jgi:hypothetical protein
VSAQGADRGKSDLMRMSESIKGAFWSDVASQSVSLGSFSPSPGARSLWRVQASSQQVQVRQRKGGKQPRSVLRQASVAHLGKAPQALHDTEGMFTAGPGGRAQAVESALERTQRPARVGTAVDAVTDATLQCALAVRLAPVRLIAKDLALLAVQQLPHLGDVRNVGRRGGQSVHDATLVGAHVRFHPKVPLTALLGLVHLRISRFILVLGRGRGLDDRGVHDRPGLEQQPLLLQQRADLGKDRLRQGMLLQKVPEAQDRRLIRDRILTELDASKAPHRLGVVQRILHRRIGQVEPLLHEVDPQHPLHRHRLGAVAGLPIVRLDQPVQVLSGDHRIHLGQETLPPRHLALLIPGRRGKRRLLHRLAPLKATARCTQYLSATPTCAELP